MLLLDLHAHGYTLAGIFFGLWLLRVGYLDYRSGLLPKVLSILVLAASGAWIIGTLVELAFPDLPGVVTAMLAAKAVVEFWLVADLLIKAVRPSALPMPRWFTQIPKRVFNPAVLRRGARPVLTQVGRSSDATYRTPLDAHPVDGGHLCILVYGSESDGARNILAAGHTPSRSMARTSSLRPRG